MANDEADLDEVVKRIAKRAAAEVALRNTADEEDDELDDLDAAYREMDRIGIQTYAARVLWAKGEKALSRYLTPLQIERIREIARNSRE
jgi:hypothetical protein